MLYEDPLRISRILSQISVGVKKNKIKKEGHSSHRMNNKSDMMNALVCEHTAKYVTEICIARSSHTILQNIVNVITLAIICFLKGVMGNRVKSP